MNKYQMDDNVDKVPGNSLYMLRLSEMYLVKAEAASVRRLLIWELPVKRFVR